MTDDTGSQTGVTTDDVIGLLPEEHRKPLAEFLAENEKSSAAFPKDLHRVMEEMRGNISRNAALSEGDRINLTARTFEVEMTLLGDETVH